MKYILPAALMLFSIAVLATGLKSETTDVEVQKDVRSTIIVGNEK